MNDCDKHHATIVTDHCASSGAGATGEQGAGNMKRACPVPDRARLGNAAPMHNNQVHRNHHRHRYGFSRRRGCQCRGHRGQHLRRISRVSLKPITEGLYRVLSSGPGIEQDALSWLPASAAWCADGIELRGGDVTAINAQLEVGNVTETVEVKATTPLLETETSSTGTVLKGEYFAQLPLLPARPRKCFVCDPRSDLHGQRLCRQPERFPHFRRPR